MIVFTQNAKSDLATIRAYYDGLSPTAGDAVAGDIVKALTTLTTFPDSGRLYRSGLMKSVSPRYRFIILHQTQDSQIFIHAIFRY